MSSKVTIIILDRSAKEPLGYASISHPRVANDQVLANHLIDNLNETLSNLTIVEHDPGQIKTTEAKPTSGKEDEL